MREKSLTCSGCGTRRDEWEADPDAYISIHEPCPGCVRIEEEQQNIGEKDRGMKVGLLPFKVYMANREKYEGR